MAKVTNALATYDVTTNREDLSDEIYMISPSDTPFMSAIPRVPASAVTHEWSTQALDSISTTNAQFEGYALSRASVTPPVRRQNICQISTKDVTITGTQDAVKMAGAPNPMAKKMAEKGLELRRDMEAILLGNTGQNAGNTTTARTLRGLNAWFSGNAIRGGSTATDSTGATYTALDATAGGIRTLTEALFKQAIAAAFDDGGNPTIALCGSFNKGIISGFTGRASAQQIIGASTIQAAADIYISDFGTIKVMPNRSQRGRDVWLVDVEKAAVAFLRPFNTYDMGKIGDADTKVLQAEYTLENRHLDAHAAVLDCTTS